MLELYFFIVGAALGSFSLVLAWRHKEGRDWLKGRSKCDYCRKTLQPFDLIPVASWLMQGGRCRYCKKKLSPQLFYAELGLASIAALTYSLWPYSFNTISHWLYFVLWLIILTLLSSLFWYDFRWQQLPVRFMQALLVLGAIEAVGELHIQGGVSSEGIIAAVSGSVLCGGFFWALYKISKGSWIGDGDSSLGFGLGLLAGSPLTAFLIIFIASVLGTLVSLPLLFNQKLKLRSKIPFGPLLILASVFVQVSGNRLVDWYMRLIGL